jgi:hypothetical protein
VHGVTSVIKEEPENNDTVRRDRQDGHNPARDHGRSPEGHFDGRIGI